MCQAWALLRSCSSHYYAVPDPIYMAMQVSRGRQRAGFQTEPQRMRKEWRFPHRWCEARRSRSSLQEGLQCVRGQPQTRKSLAQSTRLLKG